MTTKPKAYKYRVERRRAEEPTPADAADAPAAPSAPLTEAQEIEAIRQEGLTGRQLRMARRVAQKHGLTVSSDFDAVRQLRARGIDPFQRANVMDLVTPGPASEADADADAEKSKSAEVKVQLPQTVDKTTTTMAGSAPPPPPPPVPGYVSAEDRASEIRAVQRDIARRRRRNLMALMLRLAMFVGLPTFLCGHYFYLQATPMYGTKSEFMIQQSDGQGGGAFGSLLQGSSLSTQSDSVAVQSYLQSRDAFLRLNESYDFVGVFQSDRIDPIQRLDPDASQEDAYRIYQRSVKIGYDPTEGIIRMEVIAPSPQESQVFSEALVDFAEEQVDQLTQRVRNSQMAEAQASLIEANQRREDALSDLVSLQEEVGQADPQSGSAALTQRITSLQVQLDQEQLNLASQLDVRRPNEAQVNATRNEIAYIENQIASLRAQLSQGSEGSIVRNSARLRQAEENYAFAVGNAQTAQANLDTARSEASRQVRYLLVTVPPIAPDDPTYPRAFEYTFLSLLIFCGIYLMLSLTASILREQVSS